MNCVENVKKKSFWSDLDAQMLEEIGGLCERFCLPLTDKLLLVNVTTQKLHLVVLRQLANTYPISTAKNGVGQKENTGQTPLGLHNVCAKIGDGEAPFSVFRSRLPTGEIAEADVGGERIIGRILWLQGVQPGFNLGKDLEGNIVDSKDRYIYIHGTNDIANIGIPVSAGCIRMKPEDVIDLFAKVPERTPVYIYQTKSVPLTC